MKNAPGLSPRHEYRFRDPKERSTDAIGATKLAEWVDITETAFRDRILSVDIAVARLWGELSASRPLPVIDTLLAATALVHELTLVTRNVEDFASTGVVIIDPWRFRE